MEPTVQLIEQRAEGTHITDAKVLTPAQLKTITSPLAAKILTLLAQAPQGMHAAAIASTLKQSEQKIHYHVRKMRSAGIIALDHLEEGSGAVAKILRTNAGALCTIIRPLTPLHGPLRLRSAHADLLAPFIEKGIWNARIIVGSPDPHGPEGARGRDAASAIELALFLGLYLTSVREDTVVLDTELQDWKQNLIIIGGPVVNKAAERISAAMPARYERTTRAFVSQKSGKSYDGEHIGIIARAKNPHQKGREILLIAGKRGAGTRAAVLALIRELPAMHERLRKRGLVVLEGLDADSDGVIESYKIIE